MIFRRWRRRRILQHERIDDAHWRETLALLPLLQRLTRDEMQRLRELTLLFLHEKHMTPAAGAEIDDILRLCIAAQACLPILNLGLDHYGDWSSIVVYPHEFVPHREYVDDAGVVHSLRYPTLAEAWLQGPVILSAADIVPQDEMNIVIHECAHKLDMRNGDASGFPPLHRDMSGKRWSEVFQTAYADFCRRVDAAEATAIDPYAGEAPAEFFAVASEIFFQSPRILHSSYPAVYEQLQLFYRQDPRMGGLE